MDVILLLVTGLVSAAVSVLVSLLAVPATTVRQMRAEAREQSRRELAEAARALQREMRSHAYSRQPRGQRDIDQHVTDDLVKARALVEPAQRLGWFRRMFVFRRLRKVFGPFNVSNARLMKDNSGDSAFVAVLRGMFREKEDGTTIRFTSKGLWHEALSSPSGHKKVKQCTRHLWWLEHGW